MHLCCLNSLTLQALFDQVYSSVKESLVIFFQLQVINKTDLAAAVGADLSVMERDALRMRDGGPFVFAQVSHLQKFISSLI